MNGGKLERFFAHCMDVSVSWPPFSISFLNKGKTHQQLRADCWVLKVVNSSCSNFYVAGNNSWSKAKNKAKTAQTIETTSTITKTTKRRKTLVRQNGYFPAKHLFFCLCVFKMTVLVGTSYCNPAKLNTSRLKYWPSGIVINRVSIDVKRNLCKYLPLKSIKSQTVCRIIFIQDIDHFAAIAKQV